MLRTARSIDKPTVDRMQSRLSAPLSSAYGQGKFLLILPCASQAISALGVIVRIMQRAWHVVGRGVLGKSLRFHELQLKWEDSNASPDRRLRSYTMLTAGPNGGSNKDGNLEVAVQYSGPAVLPWLWQPVEQDGETVLLPQAIPHFAGTSGVTLSKWLLAWPLQRGTVSHAR